MGRGEWFAPKPVQQGLLFPGSSDLLLLLDRLVARPWRYFADYRLPMVYLAVDGTGGAGGPLRGIADRLNKSAGKKIVYARVDARARDADDSVTALRDLLNDAVSGLSGRFGSARPIRFPHYAVATWLLGLRQSGLGDLEHPDQADDQIARELRDFVKRRHEILARAGSEIQELAADFPWFIRLLTRVLPRMGLFFLRAWRVPRWFAGHAVSREHGGSFTRLTRAVATGNGGDPAALEQLLVEAMLRDLQRAYRRTGIFGAGRRRTGYPVLLLDNAGADSLGMRLLTMVNVCRNVPTRLPLRRSRAYRWDPLLIVAAGNVAGLGQVPTGSRVADVFAAGDADYAYRWWRDEWEHAGRHRSWVLPFGVPAVTAGSAGHGGLLHVGVPRVRRATMSALALLLVAATGGTALVDARQRCGSLRWQSDLGRQALDTERNQCVGLSEGQYRFFDDLSDVPGLPTETASGLQAVEETILAANEVADRRADHVTVAYLGILSGVDSGTYEAALEELRGLAIAQAERQNKNLPVRLLLANAGADMKYAPDAARAIVAEARRDDSLKAVVGLGQSRTKTGEAMDILEKEGVPMMGTLISAADLAERSAYYHQVGPTNAREAAVAAAYIAQRLKLPRVVVYFSADEDDMYSTDLHQQATAAFRAKKLSVVELKFRVPGTSSGTAALRLGRESCDLPTTSTVAFFAGRSEQFAEFVDGMDSKCRDRYPRVLAGDDVTRFVLNGGLAPYPTLQLDYLSLSRSLAADATCNQAPLDFLGAYQKMFKTPDCRRARDGRAMLARDALYTVMFAVTWASGTNRAASRDAVLDAIGEMRTGGRGAVQGRTGVIDFGQNQSSVPVNKAITVLRAVGNGTPQAQLTCGNLWTDGIAGAAKAPGGDNVCPVER